MNKTNMLDNIFEYLEYALHEAAPKIVQFIVSQH